MKLNDYDFSLPKELIANRPKPKGQARMLDFNNGQMQDKNFTDLYDILNPGDVIVVNETKVIPSELRGVIINDQDTPTSIRINLIESIKTNKNCWIAYAKPAKKLATGSTIYFGDNRQIVATVTAKSTNSGEVNLQFDPACDLLHELSILGKMPLPPYIKRQSDESDKDTYQTIFAKNSGSVAAPTAGLHFNNSFMQKLQFKGIHIAKITLHVGRGTFESVKVDDISQHKMHSEYYELDADNADIINTAKQNAKRVLCVGTTTMRTLESIAMQNQGEICAMSGNTDIFITPGFKFQVADMLLTNFHLPKSTLFILISAILGRKQALNMYKYAIEKKYRFFSYGDCCLLEIKNND